MSMRQVVIGLSLTAVLGVAGCQSSWTRQSCRPGVVGPAPCGAGAGAAVPADPNIPGPPAPVQSSSPPPGAYIRSR